MGSERPKRTAARKTAIIISSDSEEEDISTKPVHIKVRVKGDRLLVINDEVKKDSDDDYIPKNKSKTVGKPGRAKKTKGTKTADDETAVPSKRIKIDLKQLDDCRSSKTDKETDGSPRKEREMDFSFKNHSFVPWSEHELLSEMQNINHHLSQNIIKLFENDNTIPFICRYRKELISNMTPERLRDIKVTYNHIQNIKARAESIIKNLKRENNLTREIKGNILCAKSLDELDHLYAPYKQANKGSLAERAKSVGLQTPAEQILFGKSDKPIDPHNLVDQTVPDLDNIEKVMDGMKHIMSYIICRDTSILSELRNLQIKYNITIETSTSKIKVSKAETSKEQKVDASKFENYFNFKNGIRYIKPHQVLAINRAENLKVITVKIVIPDNFKNDLYNFIFAEYMENGRMYPVRRQLFDKSFDESYNKKLKPLINRQIRADLTKTAEKESIKVFASNLKQLLLMSPVRGNRILGIDPGFSNGCKMAMISEQSEVLCTEVIYPHTKLDLRPYYEKKLKGILNEYKCKLIALGNGTACRETEAWITDLSKNGIISDKVNYCIVSEQGVSIYSCSDVAKKEFPKLEVNLVSAVSIARRLNDPLGELVKVEPKHLGVGMYQHDINDKLLTDSLNEVVSECVSFVGVDINTASATLLRHIAGLTELRAQNIVNYRSENGPFRSRDDLKKVKQIGEKTFIQCAGFIRIEPITAGIKKDEYNIFDSTWIHPESYSIAEQIIRRCQLNKHDFGQRNFIEKIKELQTKTNTESLAKEFDIPEERLQGILDSLQRELFRDYRSDFDKKPLFKKGLTKMIDLKVGTIVTGSITNNTHFGCFVDIGVEKDGLIHVSNMNGLTLSVGDRVEAIVQHIELERSRIQLKLQNIL